jgi:hypothetical protein
MEQELKKDLRSILSLETIESLSHEELDYVKLKINFPKINYEDGCKALGVGKNTWYNLEKREIVLRALKEAKLSIASGVETAGDLASMAEKDILREFRQMALNKDIEHKDRIAYGKLVLEHRAKLLKSMPQLPAITADPTEPLAYLETSKQNVLAERMNSIQKEEA